MIWVREMREREKVQGGSGRVQHGGGMTKRWGGGIFISICLCVLYCIVNIFCVIFGINFVLYI